MLKRICAVTVALVLVLVLGCVLGVSAAKYEVGDVNLDGKVNIKDATAIQKHLAELSKLSSEQLAYADVDYSGKINIKDATFIQKMIAGLVDPIKPTQNTTPSATEPTRETKDPNKPIELPFVPVH